MYSFTFKNGDVLELKGIKHAAFASEETHCYEANVYFNNKKIGSVMNEGYGGPDSFAPCGGMELWKCRNRLWHKLEARIAEEHPKYFMEWDESWNDMSMEVWCGEQVNKYLATKDFNRYIKSKVVFQKPDEPKAIYHFSFKGVRSITQQHIDHIKDKYPTYKILNDMPKSEALDLWVSCNA